LRRLKPVHILAHPSLYEKIDEIRRNFKEVNGIDINLTQASDLMARGMRKTKIPKINFKGRKNEKYFKI